MEYKGNLYGKVGAGYFPLSATTEDVEKMKHLLIETTKVLGMLKRSMMAHPDCEEGSEFDDFTDTAESQEEKVNEFLKSNKI